MIAALLPIGSLNAHAHLVFDPDEFGGDGASIEDRVCSGNVMVFSDVSVCVDLRLSVNAEVIMDPLQVQASAAVAAALISRGGILTPEAPE